MDGPGYQRQKQSDDSDSDSDWSSGSDMVVFIAKPVPIPRYSSGLPLLSGSPRIISFASDLPNVPHFVDRFGGGMPFWGCLLSRGLDDPDVPVFEREFALGVDHVTLAVMWPGYGNNGHIENAVIPTHYGGMVVTRGQIANMVANAYRVFFLRSDNMTAEYEEWRVGHGGLPIERMCLVELWSPEINTWQARIHVLFPDRTFEDWDLKP